jgi:uncharacterized protein (TIGR02996 family)
VREEKNVMNEADFLRAMEKHPNDSSLRLVFADWLEERSDSRGELIRLLHTLLQSVKVPERRKLETRLRGLLESGVQPVGPFCTNSIGMKFAWIPAGTFLMGSPENDEYGYPSETQHKVILTQGYWLAIHAVTQTTWRAVMGNNPSHHKSDSLPVEQVSWDDCQEFLRRLCEKERCKYRLPTESEWEYGCRAGTTTRFYFGDKIPFDQANYYMEDKWRGETTPVGLFSPNAFGLYDMHGNVWEWCADWYGDYPKDDIVDPQGPMSGEIRVFRGGSFGVFPYDLRSASRSGLEPSDRDIYLGFRPARAT